jgi:hypothetical protein
MGYPTDFAAHIFYLLLSYAYIKKSKLRLIEYGLFLILAYIVYSYNNAKLDTICILILILIMNIYAWSLKRKIFIKIFSLSWLSVIVCCLFSVIISALFDPNNFFFSQLNLLLTGRLEIGHNALQIYKVNMFGQQIQQNGLGGISGYTMSLLGNISSYFYIDSSYIYILLSYGILFFVFFILKLALVSRKMIKMGDLLFPLILSVISISSIVDQNLFSLAYNPFILSLFASMRPSKTYYLRRIE